MSCPPCTYGQHAACESDRQTIGDCCCAPTEERTYEDSLQEKYDHDEHFGRKP